MKIKFSRGARFSATFSFDKYPFLLYDVVR
ncbi:hypothetical protein H635_YJM1083H00078 [Saccharomyces cerevisiae YJM1083]|nr:hypothetical protein H635_YJM1083H00078 [Saccharomyces cerevisiae YJM1083]